MFVLDVLYEKVYILEFHRIVDRVIVVVAHRVLFVYVRALRGTRWIFFVITHCSLRRFAMDPRLDPDNLKPVSLLPAAFQCVFPFRCAS